MIDLSDKKLELNYPCDWTYKLVVLNDHHIRNTVEDILNGKKYKLDTSKESKKGKFISYKLDIIVDDEKERIEIYNSFKKHKDIKMVI